MKPARLLLGALLSSTLVLGVAPLSAAAARAPANGDPVSSTALFSPSQTDGQSDMKPDRTELGERTPARNVLAAPLEVSDTSGRPDAALRAAVDGDPASSILLAPGDALELRFAGAPRWLDRIEVALADGAGSDRVQQFVGLGG